MSNSKKQLILNESLSLFLKYGIKAISMDDIASNCGISKRTLYLEFDSKSDLIKGIVENQIEEVVSKLSIIHDKSKNAIDELLDFLILISTIFKSTSPVTIRDLKKHYIRVYLQILNLITTKLGPFINDNFKRGIDEGFYNKNISIEEFKKSFFKILEALFDFNISQNKLKEHYQTVNFFFKLFIKELFTTKGFDEFNKRYNNNLFSR